jgi:hypothetical protein
MHGDFSQLTFSPLRRFSSVLRLQGRVELDADSNEATAILLHYMRTLASDLIGPYGGPVGGAGFEIGASRHGGRLAGMTIGFGRYYVDGLLVENHARGGAPAGLDYFAQPDAHLDPERDPLPPELPTLAYLKVWERFVSAVEDPGIRDVALGPGAPESAARTKVAWQVLATPYVPGTTNRIELEETEPPDIRRAVLARWSAGDGNWLTGLGGVGTATLRARADPGFGGTENQLYRVEVHAGGEAGSGSPEPTFNWSRDNGSVVFPIESVAQAQVVLGPLSRDGLGGLEVGQWVEVVDDAYALDGEAAPLYEVERVDQVDQRVTLDRAVEGDTGRDPALHPFLRRWTGGPLKIVEAGAGSSSRTAFRCSSRAAHTAQATTG